MQTVFSMNSARILYQKLLKTGFRAHFGSKVIEKEDFGTNSVQGSPKSSF